MFIFNSFERFSSLSDSTLLVVLIWKNEVIKINGWWQSLICTGDDCCIRAIWFWRCCYFFDSMRRKVTKKVRAGVVLSGERLSFATNRNSKEKKKLNLVGGASGAEEINIMTKKVFGRRGDMEWSRINTKYSVCLPEKNTQFAHVYI